MVRCLFEQGDGATGLAQLGERCSNLTDRVGAGAGGLGGGARRADGRQTDCRGRHNGVRQEDVQWHGRRPVEGLVRVRAPPLKPRPSGIG